MNAPKRVKRANPLRAIPRLATRNSRRKNWRLKSIPRHCAFIRSTAKSSSPYECTEARKEGKSPSRYTTTRNKKLKTEKLEIKKYNPALRRHTLHREIK